MVGNRLIAVYTCILHGMDPSLPGGSDVTVLGTFKGQSLVGQHAKLLEE